MLYRLFCRCFTLCLPLYLVFALNIAQSESRLTPSIEVEEAFLSNATSTLDESGQMTRISPGILYEASGPKASLSLGYFLNARNYYKLSQDDEVDQSLDFRSDFAHVRNQWDSYVASTIRQVNASSDAIQIVNPNLKSNNTSELRTFDIGTSLVGRMVHDIDYESRFDADYADLEDSDTTHSFGLTLGINNTSTQRNLHWRISFGSQRLNGTGEDEQIDSLRAQLDYRFSIKYSAFLRIEDNESGNELLDERNRLIGITWTPNRSSSVQFGTGKRGEGRTYTLDALINSRRITYALNYDETVTTSRTLLIDQTNQEGFFPASQELSITPELIKIGSVSVTMAGRITDLALTYFKQTTDRTASIDDDEIRDGLSLRVNRTLSGLSSVQFFLSHQESETAQKNTIDDGSLSYIRRLSAKATLSVELRKTEQASDVIENEYKSNSLSFKFFTTF